MGAKSSGGIGAVGAVAAGTDTADWVAGVKAELDEHDSSADYDVIGLAGAVYALAATGEAFDPTAGDLAAASNLADLGVVLESYQINASGGFAWSSASIRSCNWRIGNCRISIAWRIRGESFICWASLNCWL